MISSASVVLNNSKVHKALNLEGGWQLTKTWDLRVSLLLVLEADFSYYYAILKPTFLKLVDSILSEHLWTEYTAWRSPFLNIPECMAWVIGIIWNKLQDFCTDGAYFCQVVMMFGVQTTHLLRGVITSRIINSLSEYCAQEPWGRKFKNLLRFAYL